MNRFWSLLFLAVPVLGTAIVVGAAMENPVAGFWLPESIGPRTEAIDDLVNMVHLILGSIFLVTGLVLAFSLWRFSGDRPGKPGTRRGNLLLELLWTLVPTAVLGWLAFYQTGSWEANKVNIPLSTIPDSQGDYHFTPPIARVVARQFEWTFMYPGTDGEFDTRDDLFSPGLLVLPEGTDIVLELVSEDVIHSFAVNALRLKQDIIPSLKSLIWFKVTQNGEWEINCTELCGWGHYRMVAKMRVVTSADFAAWMNRQTDKLQH